MPRHARIALCLLVGILVGPVAARSPIAEVICEPTERMHDKLRHQFGETRSATGMRDPEQLMEVWTDAKGDWTLVVTYASGTSCIVAMGKDWSQAEPENPA